MQNGKFATYLRKRTRRRIDVNNVWASESTPLCHNRAESMKQREREKKQSHRRRRGGWGKATSNRLFLLITIIELDVFHLRLARVLPSLFSLLSAHVVPSCAAGTGCSIPGARWHSSHLFRRVFLRFCRRRRCRCSPFIFLCRAFLLQSIFVS